MITEATKNKKTFIRCYLLEYMGFSKPSEQAFCIDSSVFFSLQQELNNLIIFLLEHCEIAIFTFDFLYWFPSFHILAI